MREAISPGAGRTALKFIDTETSPEYTYHEHKTKDVLEDALVRARIVKKDLWKPPNKRKIHSLPCKL